MFKDYLKKYLNDLQNTTPDEDKNSIVVMAFNLLKEKLLILNEINLFADESKAPDEIKAHYKEYIDRHIDSYKRLKIPTFKGKETVFSGTTEQEASNVINQINNIWNPKTSDYSSYMGSINLIMNLSKTEIGSVDELNSIRKDHNNIINETRKLSEIWKSQSDDTQTLLNELRKEGVEKQVKDYAITFEKQADKHHKLAKQWLSTAIGLSIVFIFTFIFKLYGVFETEITNFNYEVTGYNIGNIITRAILIAIQIYFISLSFKQYNINQHLKSVNIHRKNALDSYELFAANIDKNAPSFQALMLQVAKAIYDPNVTGFLNKEGQANIGGLNEIIKLVKQENS